MKMIVGLGNPGKEYELTRHNIGFMIVDNYANKYQSEFKKKYNGLYSKIYHNGEYFIILKPLLYMNLSGVVVSKYANFFKIKPEDILVIHDDLDLPVGKIKIKSKGSSGGHNGIKNIIENLGTQEFAHFKVGIDNDKNKDTKDYVLGKFSKDELAKLDKIIAYSTLIIDDFLDLDINKVMSKYNGENYEVK